MRRTDKYPLNYSNRLRRHEYTCYLNKQCSFISLYKRNAKHAGSKALLSLEKSFEGLNSDNSTLFTYKENYKNVERYLCKVKKVKRKFLLI